MSVTWPPRVGVERGLAQLADKGAVAQILQRSDLGQHVGVLVADEAALEAGRLGELGGALDVGLLAAGAGDLAVAFHQLLEAVDVDGLAALLGELLGQLDREAERGDERECVVAGDRVAAGERLELLQARGAASRGSAPPRRGRRG